MNKKIIVGIIISAIVISIVSTAATVYSVSKAEYIRGRYGGKCYRTGTEHANIRYRIFFDTLEDCLESLK